MLGHRWSQCSAKKYYYLKVSIQKYRFFDNRARLPSSIIYDSLLFVTFVKQAVLRFSAEQFLVEKLFISTGKSHKHG